MKMNVLIISTLVSIFSIHSEAKPENVNIIKKPKEIFEDSSEANRLDKKFSIVGGITSLGPNWNASRSLGLGIFTSNDQMLLLELRSGKGISGVRVERTNSSGVYHGTDETLINSIGLHYKNFASNSFYYRIGADYSQFSYKFSTLTPKKFEDRLNEFKANNLNLSVAIGNQWQWQNFTLGCDWIGYSSPIYSKLVSETRATQANANDSSEYAALKRSYLQNGAMTLLNFYLGASF